MLLRARHCSVILSLEEPDRKFYYLSMKTKVTAEMKRLVRAEFASTGGKARAKKYSHATLSKWAKLGGRPRKNGRKK
jgi:hypothetical protein